MMLAPMLEKALKAPAIKEGIDKITGGLKELNENFQTIKGQNETVIEQQRQIITLLSEPAEKQN